ncbi:MAG: hypothetical protein F9K23_00645 [Bacteroidetes bacterium]|nr:MAG: hypothetical protein F9K23_00645 [Bacteroidota bacterium]
MEDLIIVNISNSPASGLQRKAEVAGQYWGGPKDQHIRLVVEVSYYDAEGNEVVSEGIQRYQRVLDAHNGNKVNQYGIIDPNGTEGEYDFYIRLIKNNQVYMFELFKQNILQADENGRFD